MPDTCSSTASISDTVSAERRMTRSASVETLSTTRRIPATGSATRSPFPGLACWVTAPTTATRRPLTSRSTCPGKTAFPSRLVRFEEINGTGESSEAFRICSRLNSASRLPRFTAA